MKKIVTYGLAISLFSLPLSALAQAAGTGTSAAGPAPASASTPYQFARQGVFGCNLTGSYAMSVGAMSAVGGVYVPVNDAAVTLNTGYLVYKECVLRGIVDRERESALAALLKRTGQTLTTGRDGNPQYDNNQTQVAQDRANTDALYYLQNGLSDVPASLKQPLTSTLARAYMAQVNGNTTGCPYRGDLQSWYSGQGDTSDYFTSFLQSSDPRCIPLQAALLKQQGLDAYIAQGQDQLRQQLQWGNGFLPVETIDANNQHITLTPASLVNAVAQQAVTSGFRQTENANDIDQMIGALFAGLGTQIISSTQGLAGLTQKIGSQPSYLDQVSAESAAGLRNSAANAAIQILNAALQVETGYQGIVNAIASTLTGAINQLRSIESQCWNLIIQNVCAAPPGPDGKCQQKLPACTTTVGGTGSIGGVGIAGTVGVCPTPLTLKVATSTVFSQQVIDSQITPLANQTVANIQSSQKALSLIQALITGVTNTTSVDAQRVALVQLDQLVAAGSLHNQNQLTSVQQQAAAVKDGMNSLVNDTKTAWGDSTDPSVGWCNVNNSSVIQMWTQRWAQ